MKIAFFSIHGHVDPEPNLGLVDTGGQVVYVIEMAKKLAEFGAEVDIYTRWFEPKKRIETVTDRVKIVRIPAGPPEFIRKEELFPYLDDFVNNLIRYIRKENLDYDIYHSHYWDAGYVLLRLKEKMGIKFIHTSHSLGLAKKILLEGERIGKEQYKFDRRINIELEILKKADKLVSASPLEPQLIKELYGVNREINIVPPGVDLEFFNPKNTYSVELPEEYIFTTGRIEWTKGFDLLAEAFAKIAREYPNVHLVIGGGTDPPTPIERAVRKRISEIARNNGLTERIHQVGRIPNELLPTYYARSLYVVQPSRYDLFGMVSLEALACERPVIVSKYAGVSLVLPPEIGLIADPKNIEDLASKMKYLLDNPAERDLRGRKGRGFVQANFSWKALAEKLWRIYGAFRNK